MRKRLLGRTGMVASEIGLGGAFLLGRRGDLPEEAGIDLVRYALSRGVNYIDTAECYIGGRSEAVIGKALHDYTGECIVATKFGHRPRDFDFSRESVLASAEESRRLLCGRAIDILQIHTPAVPPWEKIFSPGGALEGMQEAQKRDWVRFLGVTGTELDFLGRCLDTGAFDAVLLVLRYDLLDQSGAGLMAEAKARDIGVILASPLRMGLLGSGREEMLPRTTEEIKRRLATVEALFAEEPGGLIAGAIRFALSAPEAGVVLSGASSREELDEVLAAAATSLRPELEQAVRRLATDDR